MSCNASFQYYISKQALPLSGSDCYPYICTFLYFIAFYLQHVPKTKNQYTPNGIVFLKHVFHYVPLAACSRDKYQCIPYRMIVCHKYVFHCIPLAVCSRDEYPCFPYILIIFPTYMYVFVNKYAPFEACS